MIYNDWLYWLTAVKSMKSTGRQHSGPVLQKVWDLIAPQHQQPHSHLRPPPSGIPANIRMYLIFPETRVIGAYILSLLVLVYLYSNLCSGLQMTHLFCNIVRFGRSRSSKVDDLGTNRKGVSHFLFVPHCDCGPILHRIWDTATYLLKIAYFCYVLATPLIRRPRSPCSLWNFALKFTVRKLESWDYPPVKTAWS